jgi:hypothetical protein
VRSDLAASKAAGEQSLSTLQAELKLIRTYALQLSAVVREPSTGAEMRRIALHLSPVDADIVLAAADELDRLRSGD